MLLLMLLLCAAPKGKLPVFRVLILFIISVLHAWDISNYLKFLVVVISALVQYNFSLYVKELLNM